MLPCAGRGRMIVWRWGGGGAGGGGGEDVGEKVYCNLTF